MPIFPAIFIPEGAQSEKTILENDAMSYKLRRRNIRLSKIQMTPEYFSGSIYILI
jgi:hypothetical protein